MLIGNWENPQLYWVSLIAGLECGMECGMEWWNGIVEWNGECTQLQLTSVTDAT